MKIPCTNYHVYFRNPDRNLSQALDSASPTSRNEIANQAGPRKILPGVYAGDKSLLRGLQIRQRIEAAAAGIGVRPQTNGDMPQTPSQNQLLGEIIADQEEDRDAGIPQALSGSDESDLGYSSEEMNQDVLEDSKIRQLTRWRPVESTESIQSLHHPTDGETEITTALSPATAQLSLQPVSNASANVSASDLADKISSLAGNGLSDAKKQILSRYLDDLSQTMVNNEEGIDKSQLLSQTDEVLDKIIGHEVFWESDFINNHTAVFSAMTMCIAHKMIDDVPFDNQSLAQFIRPSPDSSLSPAEFNDLEVEVLKLMGLIDFGTR